MFLACKVMGQAGLAPAEEVVEYAGPIRPKLIADHSTVQAGGKFTLGVLFEIEKPWHIYWKYPGEAGLPTRIEFILPAGFSAGVLEWPIPEEFRQPGDLPGYGYKDEVLLFQEFVAPKVLAAGVEIRFLVNVHWLGCADVCVPGNATLELNLPVSKEAVPAKREVFEKWRKLSPQRVLPAEAPFLISTSGKPSGFGHAADLTVRIEWQVTPKMADCFLIPPQGLKLEGISKHTAGNVTTVHFKAIPLRVKGSDIAVSSYELEGLIAYQDDRSIRRGFYVPLKFR